jgi:hypothetical protein
VHWRVLVGTEGTGGTVGYSGVPEGAWENLWVLGLLGGTGGYMEELGSKRGYCGVLWYSVGFSSIMLGTAGNCLVLECIWGY